MTTRSSTSNRRNSASVHPYPSPSMVSIVLGAQWGDEVRQQIENLIKKKEKFYPQGKGKLVDLLASEADIVGRCQVNTISISIDIYSPILLGWK